MELRSIIRSPNRQPTRLWLRILGHQRNQRIILLPQRQRKDSRHNPKGLRYHWSPVDDAAQKSDLEAMLLRGNNKSERSYLITEALEKAIDKKVEHGWESPLTIDLLCHIEKVGVASLGVSKKIINRQERRTLYQHMRNPWLLFPRTFRTIREQLSTEGHPP